jgi:hypothetical protein
MSLGTGPCCANAEADMAANRPRANFVFFIFSLLISPERYCLGR